MDKTKKMLFFFAIFIVLVFVTSAAPQSSDSKIAPLVYASSGPDGKIPVIIVLKEQAQQPQASKLTRIESIDSIKSKVAASQIKVMSSIQQESSLGNAEDVKTLYLVNAISARASPSAIKRLAALDEVARIEPDVKVKAISSDNSPFSNFMNRPPFREKNIGRSYKPVYPNSTAWGVSWIEAPQLWERGINGSRVNVSIIDTGIAPHPDIADRIVAFKDFVQYIPYNGSKAFYSGKGANITHFMEMNFTLGSAPSMEFFGKYDLNYIYNSTTNQITYLDFGYVNISTDNGASWTNLRTFSGLSDGYLKETINLSAYSGTPVKIRFTLITANESSDGNGWYLDDIRVKDGSTTTFFDGAEASMNWDTNDWVILDNIFWPVGNMFYSGTGNNLFNTLDRTFDFSGYDNVTLNFTTKYDTQDDSDFGRVQVSTDGISWNTLATYSGYSAGFLNQSLNLNSYANLSNVTLRFLYTSDSSVNYDGWLVGGIQIPQIGFYDNAESLANWRVNGWTIEGPNTPYDDNGHGTHVAGTVAGNGNMGVNTGVAPGANLMGAKVLDSTGGGYSSDVIRGIEWSYENNADVVSLSLGTLPVDEKFNEDVVNPGSTAIENITVFSNPYVDPSLGLPFTNTPGAFQPTSIFGGLDAYTKFGYWYTDAHYETYLERTVNLSNVSSATLNFSTHYDMPGYGYVQVSNDTYDSVWTDISAFNGSSQVGDQYWTDVSLNLSSYAGRNVVLRFYHPSSDFVDYWEVTNISIPEIGFYDDVSNGNSGWDNMEWNFYTYTQAVDIHNLNISLMKPDGSMVTGYPVNWTDMSSPSIWFYKYTADNPLAAGTWNLTVTSNYSRPVYYSYYLAVTYPSDGTDAVSQALNQVADRGVVPVVAAGNEGEGDLGLYSINSPGASGKAITVGATDYNMDYIASFSSRGPVGFGANSTIKPDVVAPGVDIESLDLGNWYTEMTGTSMATPHVAGTVALMLQRNGSLTPAQVKQILMDSSIDLGTPGKDNTYGAGRISAYAAAVNASSDPLPPLIPKPPVPVRNELFAGATVDYIFFKPFITDATGDVSDGSIDIRGVNIDSWDYYYYFNYYNYIQIMISTASAPDLNTSEFYVYLDTDKNASTGISKNDIGADYEIKINRTTQGNDSMDSAYLYKVNSSNVSQLDFIQTLSTYVSRDYGNEGVEVTLYPSSLGQSRDTLGFYGVVEAEKDSNTDTAPDSGHGVFPYANIPIKMVGIAWNATSAAPREGINLTFNVGRYEYRYLYGGYYYVFVPVANEIRTTDANGMANLDVLVNQTKNSDYYYITVTDDSGNAVEDYEYVSLESLPARQPPFIIPDEKDYDATINETIPIKITLLTPQWQPYNNNVTLVIGDSGNYVAAELTPSSGTIEYELNLSQTTLAAGCYDCSFPVRVLNGTLNESDYEIDPGSLYIRDVDSMQFEISPQSQSASTNLNPAFLVESYTAKLGNNQPVSQNLTGYVTWVREVDVKALGEKLSPSILGKLDRMRKYALQKGKTNNLLTRTEQDELNKVLGDPGIKNIGSNYSEFNVRTDSTGIAVFNLTVPDENVYYGVIGIREANGEESSYQNSYVFVKDTNWQQHLAAPVSGDTYQSLNLWLNWNANKAGDNWIADNNFTVNLELTEYNTTSGSVRNLPGEPVSIYTNTRQNKLVYTDNNGTASVNFTAPPVDIANSTYGQIYYAQIQAWGITRFLTWDQAAVAETGYGYLGTNLGYNYSLIDIGIANSTLGVTVRYKNDGTDVINISSVLDVFRSNNPLLNDNSRADLISSYVTEGFKHVQIPVSRYGTYEARSITDDSSPFYGEYWPISESQATFTPFNTSMTYINPSYPRNSVQPIMVSVMDNGTPVQGASVYLIEQIGSWCPPEGCNGGDGGDSVSMQHTGMAALENGGGGSSGGGSGYPWGYIEANKTDANGNAVLTLRTPDMNYAMIDYRIGGATDNLTFPYLTQGSFEIRQTGNLPDLMPVIDFSEAASIIEAGKPTTISGRVRNIGDAASNSSVLSIYVNGVLLANKTIGAIPNGSFATFTQAWTPAETGTNEIKAVVDYADDELDKTNNIDTVSLTASLPDLTPEIIMPGSMQNGSTVNIDVKVRNIGGILAPASSLLVQINNVDYNISAIPQILPGDSETAHISWRPPNIGTYDIRAVSDSTGIVRELNESNNETTKVVEVVMLPDLTVASLTVPSDVRVGSTVNISARVVNLGSMASNPTNLSIYEGSTFIADVPVPPLNASEAKDYTAQWTPTILGTKQIRAIIDPNDTTIESNEGNNIARRWVMVGDRDLQVFIYSANTAISGTNESAWIYVTKYGDLKTDATNLTVNISSDTYNQTYIFNIPELSWSGQTNVTRIDVPIRSNTTIKAFVTPVDESNVTNNNASKVIVGVDPHLSINYFYRPSWQIWANTSFWTGVQFSSNVQTVVNATIQLQDGLTLPPYESRTKIVYAGVSDWNWVGWDVNVPDDYGTYSYNITISAYSANDTANARVSTIIPTATLKDFNSTVVKNGTNKTLTFASFNVTSFETSYNLTLVGGSEGRILSGLEYLFDYPNGCVEQTSSPTLAGLKTKKYYENNGLWDEAHQKTVITNKILSGLRRLETMQAASGAFAVWGGETGDDALPTIYAYYAISRALNDNDAIINNDSSVVHMNVNTIASWVATHQDTDGSWLSHYWYASYYTRTVLTGIALMDYNLSSPFLNDSVKVLVNNSRENATQYLLNSQMSDGSWIHSDSGVKDPYVTGFGLLGLAYSGNQSNNVTDAMNRSIAWLKRTQSADGYWEGTAIYKAFSTTGIRSETTAVDLQALIAAGVPTDDPAVVNAANYLIGVYEHDKSWGYTKTTQEAIQALLKVMKPETLDLHVSVSINGNTSVYYINSTNRTVVNITGNVTCIDQRVCRNTANINATGLGSVVVNVGGTQIIRYRDRNLVPAKYVDPIDEDLSLNVTIATGIEREPTLVNVSVNNPTDESIFSPLIAIPLNNTLLSGNIINRTGENVHSETINDTLYIEPIIVGNRTTESYLFNLTFNNSGYQTVQAEFAPMYNPTLLTMGNGTGYIKGHGNLTFTVYDGYDGTIGTSINVSNTTNSDLPFANLIEGSYDVNISSSDYVSVISHIGASSGVNRSYIARMFMALNQPEVVLSEFDARPAFIKASINASTGMTEYDMTVSARSRGIATVAMTIPENLNLSLAQVDSQVVSAETFNNTVYITTEVGDGSVVSLLFSYPANTTVSCLIDANRSCSSNTAESELEIHSSFNASEGNVSTSTASNASSFGASDTSLINSKKVGFRYLNITYSNLTFDWAIIRLFYYSDEITNKSINEDTLRIYWYNYNSSSWLELNNGSNYSNVNGPYVYSTAINKAIQGRGFVWANVTHFSTFAIAGAQLGGGPSGGAGSGGPPGTGSSSGGGGGVTTSEPFDNIAMSETYDKSLIANTSVTYTFKAPELGIYEISVTGKENENDVSLRVEALKGTSKLVTASPPGTVYKNVNIWAGSQRIKEAIIRFKVNNTWIDSNNFATSDVKLIHWDGSKWVQLETSEIAKDSITTSYEAKTDSFSEFAISSIKGVEVPTAIPSVGITAASTGVPGVTEKATAKTEPVNLVIIVAVIALIAIAVVLYLKRK